MLFQFDKHIMLVFSPCPCSVESSELANRTGNIREIRHKPSVPRAGLQKDLDFLRIPRWWHVPDGLDLLRVSGNTLAGKQVPKVINRGSQEGTCVAFCSQLVLC